MANEFKIKKLYTNGIILNDPSKTLVNNLNAELLNGQPSTYYQDKATAINTSNIASQTVNSANKLTTPRNININGDASGSINFDGTTDVTLSLQVNDNSHLHTSQNISDWNEAVQDTVGGMVTSNTESGISVTYDDTNGKLNFDVNDFSITLSGDVSGTATVTNLGNTDVSIQVNDNSHYHDISTLTNLQNTFLPLIGGNMAGTIGGFRESSNNFGITNGTINLNLAANNQFIIEPNGNITVNAINTPVGAITLLLIIKGNGTSFITTWGINAKWPNGTAPSIDTTANKYNLIILNTYNQGTTWFGTHQLLY